MQKVLIVDDHDDIRQMIRLTLGGQYEVLEAPNAVEAEVIVRRDKPAAVVLDVMMPGEIDGYELCRRIKADPELRHIRVILVTARGQSSDLETGKTVGADSYYVKPFSPLALVRDIKGNL
jgi:two-component system phosphate regulon response regulator PhoB